MFDDYDPWNNNNTTENNRPKNYKNSNDINKVIGKFSSTFNSFLKNKKNTQPNGNGKLQLTVAILTFLLLYMGSGFYVVEPEEEAVQLIFGKYYNTVGPGLRYHLPSPIGEVTKLKVKTVNREEIGSRFHVDNTLGHGEGVMLTGDENIVHINFDVHWRINNAYNYLFKVRDNQAGDTVKNAAESAMREIIGKSSISFAIEGKGRAAISQETKSLLQNILDHYNMGVEVLSIQLKKVDPPEKVISSFRDVQSARADKEKLINEAYAYRNQVVPRAKGEAIKIKLDAEAYESEVVNAAEGNAQRFLAIYKEYAQQPTAVRNRLYLETMEEILNKNDKVVFTDDLKGMLSHFPLIEPQK
ncbi:FtsH protease activity modulator HflK [Ehrlichia ruminantium]|uniref:Protein HflK n=3 Tax=Ehrlichia ruminantium TaxID=779 RepID=A0A0H3M217_EHRRW|nr:FtsH protease activity modulator HflK [Ehrlichia ruminantium]KYW91686.1 HflK protein [Ehrlichia ruminantium]QLK50892.1 FtsH protease activity modulator HflK [Ehrlichia ruminantium]QLK51814.1 FtsH protease activity modulator HflK [Ehrlichia ruminantium]QLK53653.1 FtsH protease activity modulator HflK [Ehrlichia ruminantium]QLK55490.1 FtsH protease activity modulator HflK [Ehrlichia ruminantium]